MSAPTLLRIAGTILLLTPIGHTQMAADVLYPGLRALGDVPAAYAAKVSWTQANGYFVTSALFCYKWAAEGGLVSQWDKYLFAALLATHLTAGAAYARKGIFPPAGVYWLSSLLMGIAAVKGN